MISVVGMEALAAAMSPTADAGEGSVLQSLQLHSNAAGDDGARALAEMLRVNTRLRTLGLRANGVSQAGGDALERALRRNRALEHLDGTGQYNDLAAFDSLVVRIDAAVARNAQARMLGGTLWRDRDHQDALHAISWMPLNEIEEQGEGAA